MKLRIYKEGGFELNEPDYCFNGIYLVGTCGSFPEQYSAYVLVNVVKYKVGYLRLRGGIFRVYYPCISSDNGKLLLEHKMGVSCGKFFDEQQRESMLNYASELIIIAMKEGVTYE